jgi:transcriptional regulator with XRE-family HTH domain
MTSLGRRLRYLRETQDLSISELANKANLSKGMVSMTERDLTVPTVDALARLCQVLHSSSDFVIWGEQTRGNDEWNSIANTEKGLMLSQIVLFLHRNNQLSELLELLVHSSAEQLTLLKSIASLVLKSSPTRSEPDSLPCPNVP